MPKSRVKGKGYELEHGRNREKVFPQEWSSAKRGEDWSGTLYRALQSGVREGGDGFFTLCVFLSPRSSSSRDRSEKAGDRGDRESRSEKGSDRLERLDRGERVDRNRSALTKRSFSKETEDRSREREKQGGPEAVRKAASMTEERDRSRETSKLGRGNTPGSSCTCSSACPR